LRQDDIVTLLPRVMQRSISPGDPFDALLAVMEGLHASTEGVVRDLDTLVRPWQAPDALLPYLSNWLDLDGVLSPDSTGAWQLPSGSGQLRALVAAAADIARWRGTARGLVLFLESATGVTGFVIEETVLDTSGQVIPFMIRVLVPPEAESLIGLVGRVVELGKPAYVQCIVGETVPVAPAEVAPPVATVPPVQPPVATVTPPEPPAPTETLPQHAPISLVKPNHEDPPPQPPQEPPQVLETAQPPVPTTSWSAPQIVSRTVTQGEPDA
jgi:phage tail-like protein